jgi:hypothetical protein
MTNEEKRISFLNRYFVFQKIATRNVEALTKTILNPIPGEFEYEEKKSVAAEESIKKTIAEVKPKVKKLKAKITLVEAMEADQPLSTEIVNVNPIIQEEKEKKPEVIEVTNVKKNTKRSTENVEKKKTTRKKVDFDIV